LSKKGYQALKDNRLADAEYAFTDLLQLAPENNYALVGLGDVFRKKRAFRRAITYYEDCLKLYPGNNYALYSAWQTATRPWDNSTELWKSGKST
jgi:tetratricopeptide (TPR) repeat protein